MQTFKISSYRFELAEGRLLITDSESEEIISLPRPPDGTFTDWTNVSLGQMAQAASVIVPEAESMTGLTSLGLILTSYEDWTIFRDADFFIEWNRDNPLICLRFYGRYFHLTLTEIEQLAQFWTEYVLPVIPDTDKTIANWEVSKIEYGPVRYGDGGDDFAWWEDEDEVEAGKPPLALFRECEFQIGTLRLQDVSTENIRELVTRFSARSEQRFDLVEHYQFEPVRAYYSFVVRPVGDRLEIEWIWRKRRWFAPIIEFLLPTLLSNLIFKPLAMWTVAERGSLSFSQAEAQQLQDLALRVLTIVGRRYIDSRPALAELANQSVWQ